MTRAHPVSRASVCLHKRPIEQRYRHGWATVSRRSVAEDHVHPAAGHSGHCRSDVEPEVGIEPTTYRLQESRSQSHGASTSGNIRHARLARAVIAHRRRSFVPHVMPRQSAQHDPLRGAAVLAGLPLRPRAGVHQQRCSPATSARIQGSASRLSPPAPRIPHQDQRDDPPLGDAGPSRARTPPRAGTAGGRPSSSSAAVAAAEPNHIRPLDRDGQARARPATGPGALDRQLPANPQIQPDTVPVSVCPVPLHFQTRRPRSCSRRSCSATRRASRRRDPALRGGDRAREAGNLPGPAG
jgi:hypothetical protein